MNPANTFDPREYVQQIHTLKAFLNDDATPGTIHEKAKAIPRISSSPGLWMLTSSGESAYLAAHFGMALSFAQFINPVGGPEAFQESRKRFKPSVESRHVKFNRQRMIVGTRDVVKEKMITLARDYNVNEIVAAAYRRRRSPKLLMSGFAPMNSWPKSSTSKIRTRAETNRRKPFQKPPPDSPIKPYGSLPGRCASPPYFPI